MGSRRSNERIRIILLEGGPLRILNNSNSKNKALIFYINILLVKSIKGHSLHYKIYYVNLILNPKDFSLMLDDTNE